MTRHDITKKIEQVIHTLEFEAENAPMQDQPFGEGLKIAYSNSAKIVDELTYELRKNLEE